MRAAEDNEWLKDARCANLGMTEKGVLDIFYPETGSRRNPAEAMAVYRRAQRICAECPVRKNCLEDALRYEEGQRVPLTGKWSRRNPAGVWGGHRPKERHVRDIVHYPNCGHKAPYPGCRPIPERVEMLEETFQFKLRHLLTDKELNPHG